MVSLTPISVEHISDHPTLNESLTYISKEQSRRLSAKNMGHAHLDENNNARLRSSHVDGCEDYRPSTHNSETIVIIEKMQ
jgi:hypothetical protein